MNISKELIEKAKTAKSAEELLAMAKAENIELNAEEAAQAFAKMNKNGELSDEELDNVAGGCGDNAPKGPKYSVGDWVTVDINYGGYRPCGEVISVWKSDSPMNCYNHCTCINGVRYVACKDGDEEQYYVSIFTGDYTAFISEIMNINTQANVGTPEIKDGKVVLVTTEQRYKLHLAFKRRGST
jgi:hypothetical protein